VFQTPTRIAFVVSPSQSLRYTTMHFAFAHDILFICIVFVLSGCRRMVLGNGRRSLKPSASTIRRNAREAQSEGG